MVEVFAKNGANIWACARNKNNEFEAEITGIAQKYGVWVKPIYFDIADENQIKAGFKTIAADKLSVDSLINNAGVTYNALFQMTSMGKMKETFQINFFGPFLFTQFVIKQMLKHKAGSIVNIASSAALDGNAGRAAYGASKAAVICQTKAIAEELGASGIRANAIAPGITDTDMVGQSMSDEVINETVMNSCLKRIGQPIEIANTAAFLASDRASYITGQVFRVDGGM